MAAYKEIVTFVFAFTFTTHVLTPSQSKMQMFTSEWSRFVTGYFAAGCVSRFMRILVRLWAT